MSKSLEAAFRLDHYDRDTDAPLIAQWQTFARG